MHAAGVRGDVVEGAAQALGDAGLGLCLPQAAKLGTVAARAVLPDDALWASEGLARRTGHLSQDLVVVDARGDGPIGAEQGRKLGRLPLHDREGQAAFKGGRERCRRRGEQRDLREVPHSLLVAAVESDVTGELTADHEGEHEQRADPLSSQDGSCRLGEGLRVSHHRSSALQRLEPVGAERLVQLPLYRGVADLRCNAGSHELRQRVGDEPSPVVAAVLVNVDAVGAGGVEKGRQDQPAELLSAEVVAGVQQASLDLGHGGRVAGAAFALRHVAQGVRDQGAAGELQGACRDLDWEHLAVAALVLAKQHERAVRAARAQIAACSGLGRERGDVEAEQFLSRETVHALGGLVDIDDALRVVVDDQQRIRVQIEHAPVALLAAAQLLLRTTALVDLPEQGAVGGLERLRALGHGGLERGVEEAHPLLRAGALHQLAGRSADGVQHLHQSLGDLMRRAGRQSERAEGAIAATQRHRDHAVDIGQHPVSALA